MQSTADNTSEMPAPAGAQVILEMGEQPTVLAGLVEQRADLREQVRTALPDTLRGVSLIARGSSDNVAVHARYLLELATGLPVSLMAPSLITRYHRVPDLRDHLVVALSQSGRTPEIVDVARQAAGTGATVVAVTNDIESPLADMAAATLSVGTSRELAVPATKTVTGQLALVVLLAEACGPDGNELDSFTGGDAAWSRLAETVSAVLDDSAVLGPAVEVMASANAGIHLARGLTYAAALEGALKMKETTRRVNEGFSSADFLHGPLTVAQAGIGVVAYGVGGPVLDDVIGTARAAMDLGAQVIGVGDPAVAAALSGSIALPTPQDLGEALSIIPLVVRGQQLAVQTTLAVGLNPDAPQGLNKVTATH